MKRMNKKKLKRVLAFRKDGLPHEMCISAIIEMEEDSLNAARWIVQYFRESTPTFIVPRDTVIDSAAFRPGQIIRINKE